MIKNLVEKKNEDDQGFTLIELMVVVLIIAILLAIAIPTFLGAKNTANARAAEANLRNALTAETSYFTNNNQVYGNAAAMQSIEGAINWTDMGSQTSETYANNGVWIAPSPGSSVQLLAIGQDGNCYWVQDASGTVSYAKVAKTSGSGSSTTCSTTLPGAYVSGNPATWQSSTTAAQW